MRYRPVDVAGAIAPRALMLIAVEGDAVTPEDHARALYAAAGEPKLLVVQTGTTHYAAYERYRDIVNPMIVEWFERHLVTGDLRLHTSEAGASGIRYVAAPPIAADGAPASAVA